MILARIINKVEEILIAVQAGFIPGRSFCGQALNLTQYIQDGFENKRIIRAVVLLILQRRMTL